MNAAILRPLRYRNFRLYFTGQSVSLIGTWMQRMAASWLVYSMTHSAWLLGVVTFAGQIPTLLLSPYGGATADRHSRYRILLLTQIASLGQAAALAALVLSGHYSTAGIILLSLTLGIINAFDIPARQSLMIELIDDRQDLPQAITLNSTMVNVARLAGPVVAGILLTAYGEGVCFLVNALSFAGVIGSLLLIRVPPRVIQKTGESVWTGLREGYAYLRLMPELRLVILLMAGISFVALPYATLLPVFAQEVFHGDATTFSWLNSVSGLGAIVGAVVLASLGASRDRGYVVLAAAAVFAASLIGFSLTSWLPLALFFILTEGAGMIVNISGSNAFIQMQVDDRMRGRVISYFVMAFQGMQPLGSLLVGWVAHRIGPQHTVLAQGALALLIVAAFTRQYRKLARTRRVRAAELAVAG